MNQVVVLEAASAKRVGERARVIAVLAVFLDGNAYLGAEGGVETVSDGFPPLETEISGSFEFVQQVIAASPVDGEPLTSLGDDLLHSLKLANACLEGGQLASYRARPFNELFDFAPQHPGIAF
eukprot:gene21192-biopygen9349